MKKIRIMISLFIAFTLVFSALALSASASYPSTPTGYYSIYNAGVHTICVYKDSSKWYCWRRTITDPVRHSYGYETQLCYEKSVSISSQTAVEFGVELGCTATAYFVEASLSTSYGMSVSAGIEVTESTSVAYTIPATKPTSYYRIVIASEFYKFRNDMYYGMFRTPPTSNQTIVLSEVTKIPRSDPYVALLVSPSTPFTWSLA